MKSIATKMFSQNPVSPQEQLNNLSVIYLKKEDTPYSEVELEAKFGTRGIKPLTKIDYDNVIKKISVYGWTTTQPNGEHLLRIQSEFLDAKTGQFRTNANFDTFRVEIQGINSIQEYCKTNSIRIVNDKNPHSVKIQRKFPVKNENDEPFSSADFNDFNFRVSVNVEETVSKTSKIGTDVFENWNKSKKVFRHMNRITFTHPEHAFKIELSIVKSSTKNERKQMIQTYSIEESNVFVNPEVFEIEVEASKRAKQKYNFNYSTDFVHAFQKVVKLVLCGLQKTNFPISYPEQRSVLNDYHRMLFEEEYKKRNEEYVSKNIYPSDFIGPGLVTLDLLNISPMNSNITAPNITEPFAYCVTEKADGDRHLLYVNNRGMIYLISMNMSVIFTGAKTEESKCFQSLLDGELILHNKQGDYINVFAAFDIYYIHETDIRSRPFINTFTKDERYFKEGCRLPIMKEFIKLLKPIGITQSVGSPIKIISKKFYPTFGEIEREKEKLTEEGVSALTKSKYNIFEANNYLLRRIADGEFEYEIDGLIFTPTLLGVGGNKILEAGPKKKITWPHIFKWKPSEATAVFPKSYNTIDFLVVTKKGVDGKDIITPIFENGMNNYESTQFKQYKTLILAVGFDPAKHGYLNPCQEVLDDRGTVPANNDDKGYKPKQFYPSNPFDSLAGICNIMLELDDNGTHQMFTEEREVFGDQMVVEFRYDSSKPGTWKWIPMRVRYDKTADFRAGHGVGANDYTTANNNWHSIHYPITEQMIASGEGIPGIEVSDDVYYNSVVTAKNTQRMRDFHNLFVKKMLIQSVSKKGGTLMDFACGKAGDLPKWIAAELSFVFGIDISKDNLENRINGACARYLNFKMTNKHVPYVLFVNGNCGKNIRKGTNMFSDKENRIVQSVFGSIGVDKSLGPAVVRQHGKGQNGFDVTSCQFAMHYMFENKHTFYNFIQNVAECTKLNGYFIATCYDGRTMFHKLEEMDEEEIYDEDNKKIWLVSKKYEAETFEDNESCLGYAIDVYQDSINQTITEYLVNFDFLTITMEKYGFALITREEAKQLKLPNGTGMFSELFNLMNAEINQNPKKEIDYKDAQQMQLYEKDISFLNRYVVYKKISTRNAEKLTKSLLEQIPEEEHLENVGTLLAREAVRDAEAVVHNTKKEEENEREKNKKREEDEEELLYPEKGEIIEEKKNEIIEESKVEPKAKKVKRLNKKLLLMEATEAVEEPKKIKTRTKKPVAENVTGDVLVKKKTTRRKLDTNAFEVVP
jgi:hypothetical protein